jgi:hypothetical protein
MLPVLAVPQKLQLVKTYVMLLLCMAAVTWQASPVQQAKTISLHGLPVSSASALGTLKDANISFLNVPIFSTFMLVMPSFFQCRTTMQFLWQDDLVSVYHAGC